MSRVIFVVNSIDNGEYQRTLNPLFAFETEDAAKAKINEYDSKHEKIANLIRKMFDPILQKLKNFNEENPEQKFDECIDEKPKFDQNRQFDKEYVKEHTKRKHEWDKKRILIEDARSEERARIFSRKITLVDFFFLSNFSEDIKDSYANMIGKSWYHGLYTIDKHASDFDVDKYISCYHEKTKYEITTLELIN